MPQGVLGAGGQRAVSQAESWRLPSAEHQRRQVQSDAPALLSPWQYFWMTVRVIYQAYQGRFKRRLQMLVQRWLFQETHRWFLFRRHIKPPLWQTQGM